MPRNGPSGNQPPPAAQFRSVSALSEPHASRQHASSTALSATATTLQVGTLMPSIGLESTTGMLSGDYIGMSMLSAAGSHHLPRRQRLLQQGTRQPGQREQIRNLCGPLLKIINTV